MLFRAPRVPLSGSRLQGWVLQLFSLGWILSNSWQSRNVLFIPLTICRRGLISLPCDDWPRDTIRRMCQESRRRGNLIYRAFSRYDAAPLMHMRPAAEREVCRRRDFCCGNWHQELRGPGGSWSRAHQASLRRQGSLEWSICNKYVFSVIYPCRNM